MSALSFALVTSDNLMDKVTSWDSYQNLEEEQFKDLVEYSKELIDSDENHRITFLVVAMGNDEAEQKETEAQKELSNQLNKKIKEESLLDQKRKSLRANSENILNSIYGI
jgi:hypothetical protein